MTQSVQNFDNRNNGYAVPGRNYHQGRVQQQAVRIPDFYAPDKKSSIKDALEDNPMYSTVVKGFFGPLIEHPIASILTWFGCGFLLDKYTAACGGEYEKSLLKKVTNFGDKIENSKFIQSKPVQSVLGWFKKGGQKSSKFLGKSSVLKAIKNTPSMPEWEMVKSEMIPQRQRVVHDFNLIVNELKLMKEGFAPLHKLGLDKKEKDALKAKFKVSSLSEIPEERASSFIQLKRLGKSEAEIFNIIAQPDGGVASTKKAILQAMGDKNEAWLKAVHEDTVGNPALINEVQEATKKVGSKVKVCMGNYRPFGINLGVLTTPSKRIVGCDSVYNRLWSLDKNGGAKTATGRFMSKFMQMVHRGLTFGGGKWGVLLFIAPAFVETAINVHKAEPNQKVGTGVNNLVNHISWVFTFPFALQIMHHICGAQYAGMSKEQVQQLRKLQTDFNKKNALKVDDGGFKDYEAYNKERIRVNNEMKKLKRVKGQKWYTKCIRKIAGFITPDLGKLDAYNTKNIVTTKISQLRNLPRNLVGVPLRLLIFGGLTMGVLDTILNKSIKLIFGDSYDAMKEEEIKDAKKEQKKILKEDLNDRLYDEQRKKLAKAAALRKKKTSEQQNINNQKQTAVAHRGLTHNMAASQIISQEHVNKVKTIDNYSYIPSSKNIIKPNIGKTIQDTYTYIPSQISTVKSDKNNLTTGVRTYIPSQAAANISKTWDNSGLQKAFDRAQRAEERAMKVLAGNFEN